MGVFKRFVLNGRKLNNNGSNYIGRRSFGYPWYNQPLGPNATWLERWSVKEIDWVVLLLGDFVINMCYWSHYFYYWCVESDARKIWRYNNWRMPNATPHTASIAGFIEWFRWMTKTGFPQKPERSFLDWPNNKPLDCAKYAPKY